MDLFEFLHQVNHDPEKTREEILSLIAHHVTAVNYIYRDTKFDGRIEHRNIKFEVQRIKVKKLKHRIIKNPIIMMVFVIILIFYFYRLMMIHHVNQTMSAKRIVSVWKILMSVIF